MQILNTYNRIAEQFSKLTHQIQASSALGQSDINKIAQHLFVPLLNNIYEWNLRDLDLTDHVNFPAVDLGDDIKRIAVQVTASPSLEKIKDTIATFRRNGLSSRFDRLVIVVITQRQNSYSQKAIDIASSGELRLSAIEDILDHKDILKRVSRLPSPDQQTILDILVSAVGDLGPIGFFSQITDALISVVPEFDGEAGGVGLLVSEDGFVLTSSVAVGPIGNKPRRYYTLNGIANGEVVHMHDSGLAIVRLDGSVLRTAFRPSKPSIPVPDGPITAWSIDGARQYSFVNGEVQYSSFVGSHHLLGLKMPMIGRSFTGAPLINAEGQLVGVLTGMRHISTDGSTKGNGIGSRDIQRIVTPYLDMRAVFGRP
jgi:hypothetical protein